MDLLSKPSNVLFWTRSPFPTWEFGFVGANVFGLSGNRFDSFVKTLPIASMAHGDRSSLLLADQPCRSRNESFAMHRNAARFYCGVFNDQISRGQTDGRICIRRRHRCRLIRLHGADMWAEFRLKMPRSFCASCLHCYGAYRLVSIVRQTPSSLGWGQMTPWPVGFAGDRKFPNLPYLLSRVTD